MYTVSTNEIAIILIVYTIILIYVLWDRKYNQLESKRELDDIVIKKSIEPVTRYDDNKYRRMIRSRDIIKNNSTDDLNNMSLKHLSLIIKLSDLGKEILNSIKINKEDLSSYLTILNFKSELKTVIVEENILDMLLDTNTEILNIVPLSFNNMKETIFIDEKHSSRRSILAEPNRSIELRGHHKPSYSYINYMLFIKTKNKQAFGLHIWLDIRRNVLKVYPTRYIYTENNWFIAMDALENDRLLELLDMSHTDRLTYIKKLASNGVNRIEVMDIDNSDSTLIPINIHIVPEVQ